jgi:transposase
MKQEKAVTLNRRKYDEDFKRSALKMIDNGQSVRSVSQSLGVSENQLHKWKREVKRTCPETEKEVAELRARLRQVETERDILKKALCIFSRQS